MRNLFLVVVMVMIMFFSLGCVDKREKPRFDSRTETTKNYNVVTLDGCEYIEVERNTNTKQYIYFFTHKGNCKNPIHIYSK